MFWRWEGTTSLTWERLSIRVEKVLTKTNENNILFII